MKRARPSEDVALCTCRVILVDCPFGLLNTHGVMLLTVLPFDRLLRNGAYDRDILDVFSQESVSLLMGDSVALWASWDGRVVTQLVEVDVHGVHTLSMN